MKNWKEEFKEKLWKLKYLELSVNDIIKEVEKIEQHAYKRGLEDKEKINKCDPVKLTYEELIDLNRAKKEGVKEGLESVLELLKYDLLPVQVREENPTFWKGYSVVSEKIVNFIQQQLKK